MSRTTLTYADYAALPDDGQRYELHDGELRVTPSPGLRHQVVLLNLAPILRDHARTRSLGIVLIAPFDCIMSDATVVQPDIMFVDAARAFRVTERGIEGAPTLAIEVLSPSTDRLDRVRKLALYARHGVEHYWIVDPAARSIQAHSLIGGELRQSGRLSGRDPIALPPFADLLLDPTSLWE